MPIESTRPLTPSQRFYQYNRVKVDKKRPERALTESISKSGGRNNNGRMTMRRRGGGHKKLYRLIDFKRNRLHDEATVIAIEYDPNRTCHIALVEFADQERRYIPAPAKLAKGDVVISSDKQIDFKPGNHMPLEVIPPSTKIHCIELIPGQGAKIARSAGTAAQLVAIDGGMATLKMPSGELRYVNQKCRATIGEVGNREHENQQIGKAGRNRWKGKRPRVRGVAMNPVDHPMGGGEGRTSGGGHPVSPWGQLAKGYPTRRKSKPTNKMILVRRNGRRMKK